MALKINFKDFKAQYPFRFTAKTTKEEANKLLSGIEANMDILPNFEVEEGTEVNSSFFRQLEKDINADQIRQDEEFQIAIDNIEVPVKSVNTKTGHVTLTASDVGAVPTARKVNNKALSADVTLTKADVGLGNVENYGIATEAEALAGTSNVKYMTPMRTMQSAGVHGGMKQRVFVENGSFRVSQGVTEIYVTACGGGGGAAGIGTGSPTDGATGGTTTLSGVVSLPGGGGASGANYGDGLSGGVGGGNGGKGGGGGSYGDGGGGGSAGSGGGVGSHPGSAPSALLSSAGGAMGAGGGHYTSAGLGAGFGGGGGGHRGGGGGSCIVGKPYTVTPNQLITITVGKGGAGGTGTSSIGGVGGSGIAIIEW